MATENFEFQPSIFMCNVSFFEAETMFSVQSLQLRSISKPETHERRTNQPSDISNKHAVISLSKAPHLEAFSHRINDANRIQS